MKLYATCERCGKHAEAFHSPGGSGIYAQMQGGVGCSFSLSVGWRAIDGKNFCGDCSRLVQSALDQAMRPVPA